MKQIVLYDASMNSPAATEPADKPRRKYNSTRRSLQAAQTRDDVLAAAIRRFSTAGWAGTTIAGIAPRPASPSRRSTAVSARRRPCCGRQWTSRSSATPSPIPFADRAYARRMAEGTASERLDAAAEITADVHERSAGVWSALIEAAAADPEIDGWRQELERGRRIEVARSVRAMLGPDVDVDEFTVDLAWVIFGPEVYLKVTTDLATSRAGYEAFIREGFSRLIAAL